MIQLALARAARIISDRIAALEGQLGPPASGASGSTFELYLSAVRTLIQIEERRSRGGGLVTTKELAESYSLSPKTVLRWRGEGKITPALIAGKRGRGAIRWAPNTLSGRRG